MACTICIISKQGEGSKMKMRERKKIKKRNEYFWFVVDRMAIFVMVKRLSRKMNNKVVDGVLQLWILETKVLASNFRRKLAPACLNQGN